MGEEIKSEQSSKSDRTLPQIDQHPNSCQCSLINYFDINQVVQKLKSGVSDDYFIIGNFTDILANERLEEPTEGKYFLINFSIQFQLNLN